MFLISSFVVIFFLMVNEILSNCLNMISIKLKISSWTYSVINTWLKRGEGQFILLVEKISQWSDSCTLSISWPSSEHNVSHSIFMCNERSWVFCIRFVVSVLYIMFVQERNNGMFYWIYHEVYIWINLSHFTESRLLYVLCQ